MILVIWHICFHGVVSVILIDRIIIEHILAPVLPLILRAVMITITVTTTTTTTTATTTVCIIVAFTIKKFEKILAFGIFSTSYTLLLSFVVMLFLSSLLHFCH